jgi:aspartate/methionine/tyrosine aminotransferase
MRDRHTRVTRLIGVPGISVDRVGAAADEAARGDPGLLRLENLDTDLRPPTAALEATKAAVDADARNSYLPFLGQQDLRSAAARHVGRLSAVEYDAARECIVTAGGLNGCLITLLALLDPGDEVILTDPTYAGMINRVRIAGGTPVLVPFEWIGKGWRLDLDALRRAVTAKTKAMFLMSPSMPSGAVLSHREWEAVALLCRDADLWLIYNAAMERILYDGVPHVHPAGLPGMADRTITVGSVSKEFRMIGWRVGWVVGPAQILNDIGLVAISDVVVPVGIAQPAAAAALSAPDSDADVAAAVEEWGKRRDVLLEELEGLPLRGAAGGWSMLLDAGEMGETGEQASELLMEKGRIAATPMLHWGVRNGPQFVRLVFSNEPVERLRGVGARVRRALAGPGRSP